MSLWSLFSMSAGRSDLVRDDLMVRPLARWFRMVGRKVIAKRVRKVKRKRYRRRKVVLARKGKGFRFSRDYQDVPNQELYESVEARWRPREDFWDPALNLVMPTNMVTVIGVESRGVGFYFLNPKEREQDGLLTKEVTMTIGASCVHSVKLEGIRNDGSLNFRLLQRRKLKNDATKHLVVYGTDAASVYDRAASMSHVVPYDGFTKKGIRLTTPKRTTWDGLDHVVRTVFDPEKVELRNEQRYYEHTQEYGVDPRVHEFEMSAPDYLINPIFAPVFTRDKAKSFLKRRELKRGWADTVKADRYLRPQVEYEQVQLRSDGAFDSMIARGAGGRDVAVTAGARALRADPVWAAENYGSRVKAIRGVQDTRNLIDFQQIKVAQGLYDQRAPNRTPDLRLDRTGYRMRDGIPRLSNQNPRRDQVKAAPRRGRHVRRVTK